MNNIINNSDYADKFWKISIFVINWTYHIKLVKIPNINSFTFGMKSMSYRIKKLLEEKSNYLINSSSNSNDLLEKKNISISNVGNYFHQGK